MVVPTRREPQALTVLLQRDGEPDEVHLALTGERALIIVLRIIIAHTALRAGDRLTIKAAD
jgi:hypothetical protein